MSEPIRVLLVDDEEMVRDSMAAFLEDEGFHVLTAATAEECLQTLAAAEVDACIVDLRLAGGNGENLIIQVLAAHPLVRCLLHTGSSDYTLSDELLGIGMTTDDIIFKPVFDMRSITKKIHEKVEGGQGR